MRGLIIGIVIGMILVFGILFVVSSWSFDFVKSTGEVVKKQENAVHYIPSDNKPSLTKTTIKNVDFNSNDDYLMRELLISEKDITCRSYGKRTECIGSTRFTGNIIKEGGSIRSQITLSAFDADKNCLVCNTHKEFIFKYPSDSFSIDCSFSNYANLNIRLYMHQAFWENYDNWC